jgi:hypothetical protein
MMGKEVAIMQAAPVPAFGFNEVEKIATAIARGGMFGSKDPYAVLTLCMLAQAEGQHPAVVFRDYDLIQGKPAKKAEAMQRDFMASGGKITWNRLDDECADATFSHPQGGTVTINWTLARATKAGLGGKDMWKKYPRQMLRARVVSEGVRTVCPNATSGLYVPEEVRDFGNQIVPSDTPPTPEPKRARDLKAEQPKAIEAQPDYSATLVELESVCGPGHEDALADAWQKIGKDARKALADELPRLKSLCEPLPEQTTLAEQLGLDETPIQRVLDDLETAAEAGDSAAVERIIAAAEQQDFTDDEKMKLEVAYSNARGRVAESVE